MPHTHLSSGAGTKDQIVADVPTGLTVSLTPSYEIKKEKLFPHNKERRLKIV
jgi:hypothetical protein